MDVTAGHAAAIYRGTVIFSAPKSELSACLITAHGYTLYIQIAQ